jgi:hypothetical protein
MRACEFLTEANYRIIGQASDGLPIKGTEHIFDRMAEPNRGITPELLQRAVNHALAQHGDSLKNKLEYGSGVVLRDPERYGVMLYKQRKRFSGADQEPFWAIATASPTFYNIRHHPELSIPALFPPGKTPRVKQHRFIPRS